VNELGIRATFVETTYSFCIIGAFFGASMTVEKSCGSWWKSNRLSKIIKLAIVIPVSVGYVYGFSNKSLI
jgi:hypothetical protein